MNITLVNDQTLEQAARVHAVSWRESHKALCSPAFVASHTTRRQMDYLRSEMAAGKQVFLLWDPEPVGLVSVDGGVIANLYVLPSEQRKGYGTRLLEFAISQCSGIPSLWVLSSNTVAHALYFKRGFRETGVSKELTEGLYQYEMRLL